MAKSQKDKNTSAPSGRKAALDIAKKTKSNVVLVNSKGEFFTDMNRALLSDTKDKITEFKFSVAEIEDKASSTVSTEVTITEELLEANPDLKEKGYKVGDVVDMPV